MNSPSASMSTNGVVDDPRLTRLFEYTKFHIGIYLSAGAGLLALLTADGKRLPFSPTLVNRPVLYIALAFMLLAGMAGGIIASSTTQCHTFDELWTTPQGPYKWGWWSGQTWALIEHGSFWISVLLLIVAVQSAFK
jgi:hypothetical protein